MTCAAEQGLDRAVQILDQKEDSPSWSEALIRTISEDHFGDGKTCVITDPRKHQELRVDAYEYDDGSGFAVDHDLAMNDQVSDFTAQLEFIRTDQGYSIFLTDIHVL